MCSVKKAVYKNLAKFTRKHLCYLSFNKITGLRTGILIQRCFPVNFVKFLRAPILKNICERLLLNRRAFEYT